MISFFQNKDWIHVDTTPLYAMVRFSGAALGLVSHPRTLVLANLGQFLLCLPLNNKF